MSFTYLSIPYSHPDPSVCERRMTAFWKAAAELIKQGKHVVSPMTLEPALRAAPGVPYDWAHWERYSLLMMGVSESLVVLTLDGWEQSTGVRGEIAEATRLGLPVEFMAPEDAQ